MFAIPIFLFLPVSYASAQSDERPEINTILMRSTFELVGKGSIGTAFIMGKPSAADPQKSYFVMVTAAHVMRQMETEEAVLLLRTRKGDQFQKFPFPVKVRNGESPLWTTHPEADVAVMYVSLPTEADVTPVSTKLLATDEMLQQFEVHPGDRLSCLGFPYGAQANNAGFPILRSGYIASYPITPTKATKTFLFDFNIFEGNSGGPVYFVDSNRVFGGSIHLGTVQFLVGLISEQRVLDEEVKGLSETRRMRHKLGLGVVIHASLIREAIDLLQIEPKE